MNEIGIFISGYVVGCIVTGSFILIWLSLQTERIKNVDDSNHNNTDIKETKKLKNKKYEY